mmetsp:Transcript_41185/g.62645  ORF Transcript_41185/g.62645 Transcript_41185/m.62645 type:complete len:136 (-) Transcript_41185:2058-2465(-)
MVRQQAGYWQMNGSKANTFTLSVVSYYRKVVEEATEELMVVEVEVQIMLMVSVGLSWVLPWPSKSVCTLKVIVWMSEVEAMSREVQGWVLPQEAAKEMPVLEVEAKDAAGFSVFEIVVSVWETMLQYVGVNVGSR